MLSRDLVAVGKWDFSMHRGYIRGLEDMREAAIELCESNTKELAAWTEEFLILAKEAERWSKARYTTESPPIMIEHLSHRHRLRVEAALWKLRNPTK